MTVFFFSSKKEKKRNGTVGWEVVGVSCSIELRDDTEGGTTTTTTTANRVELRN